MSAPGTQFPSNWGRWGPEDERGMANLLTPERIRAAAGLVRTGRVFPLALPIQPRGVPVFPRRTPSVHFMTVDGGDYAAGLKRQGGLQTSDDYLCLYGHGGTHVDALAHVWYDDVLYNGYPATGVRSSGAKRLGIEKLGSLVGRGVLLDLCEWRGVARLEKGSLIGPDELTACAEAQGTPLAEGCILLIRTGWLSIFRDEGEEAFFAGEPGIGMAAARFLAETGVVAIGTDNFAVEVIPTETGESGPVHKALIRDAGMYLMELLDLDALAGAGAREFLFVAAPLTVTGGVGSPITPLAIA